MYVARNYRDPLCILNDKQGESGSSNKIESNVGNTTFKQYLVLWLCMVAKCLYLNTASFAELDFNVLFQQ